MTIKTLNVAEACAAGDCVERTIYRNIENGNLKAEKIDGAWAIDAESLADWNAGRKATRERAERTRASYETLAELYRERRTEALANAARVSSLYLDAIEAMPTEKPDAREFDSNAVAILRAAADQFATVCALREDVSGAYAAAIEAHNEAKMTFDAERAEIDAAYHEGIAALTQKAEKVGVDIL